MHIRVYKLLMMSFLCFYREKRQNAYILLPSLFLRLLFAFCSLLLRVVFFVLFFHCVNTKCFFMSICLFKKIYICLLKDIYKTAKRYISDACQIYIFFIPQIFSNCTVEFYPPTEPRRAQSFFLNTLICLEFSEVACAPLRARRKTHPIPPYREGTELLCSSTYQR